MLTATKPACPQCGGEVHVTDGFARIAKCQKPVLACGWGGMYFPGERMPWEAPNENTAPALDGNGTASALDEHPSVYTTAPDPDAWTTSDQLEWLDSYR